MNDITKLKLPRSNSWYYENGYLTIDLDLFGKYLCAVFNKFLGEYYYFQKFNPIIKTDKERPIDQQGEEKRNLAIISPKLYTGDWTYDRVRKVHMSYLGPSYLPTASLNYKPCPTLFSMCPLKLDEKDFLLYFGNDACERVEINLGFVENETFIPNSFRKPKISQSAFGPDCEKEICYANPVYSFIEDFIKEIFYYKIVNIRPNLDQSDMDLILEEFGISRKEKIQTLIELFKSMQEEATKRLLESNNVGNVLKLKKSDKNVK